MMVSLNSDGLSESQTPSQHSSSRSSVPTNFTRAKRARSSLAGNGVHSNEFDDGLLEFGWLERVPDSITNSSSRSSIPTNFTRTKRAGSLLAGNRVRSYEFDDGLLEFGWLELVPDSITTQQQQVIHSRQLHQDQEGQVIACQKRGSFR